jgi:hypothetical protein
MSNKLNRPAIFTDKMIEAAERLFGGDRYRKNVGPHRQRLQEAVLLRLQLKGIAPSSGTAGRTWWYFTPTTPICSQKVTGSCTAQVEKARVAAGLRR